MSPIRIPYSAYLHYLVDCRRHYRHVCATLCQMKPLVAVCMHTAIILSIASWQAISLFLSDLKRLHSSASQSLEVWKSFYRAHPAQLLLEPCIM